MLKHLVAHFGLLVVSHLWKSLQDFGDIFYPGNTLCIDEKFKCARNIHNMQKYMKYSS